jgi:hypothetical protein
MLSAEGRMSVKRPTEEVGGGVDLAPAGDDAWATDAAAVDLAPAGDDA